MSNYDIIALISHASKVMLKILQARLQQYVNHELPDVRAGFRKGRGTRDQTSNNTREDSTHGHHQMVNTKIRLIIFFAANDGEALYSQQNQDQELTVAQIMNLLPNSDLN